MTASVKSTAGFIILLSSAFLLNPALLPAADSPASAEDIAELARKTVQIADTFMQQSFRLRMAYEYKGRFLISDDKQNLYNLAEEAAKSLEQIAEEQQQFMAGIEACEANDWDKRYGSTGLWRKLRTDICTTRLTKCQIDFYLALSTTEQQRNKMLNSLLTEMASLDLITLPAASQLLKAKTFALLSRTNNSYRQMAEKELNELMIRSDMRHSTALKASIERIKFLGPTDANGLDKLNRTIANSSCTNDIELVLSLAFLRRKYDPNAFEKAIKIWPQIEDFLGYLILADLSGRTEQQQGLSQLTTFEAELAAQAAWRENPQKYQTALAALAEKRRFQTPLILYVNAAALAQSKPTEAVELLIKSSSLQDAEYSKRLDTGSEEIARQAAQLAYGLFEQKKAHCSVVLEAFDNYSSITKDTMEQELEYLYTIVLNSCGKRQVRLKLLEKIASRPSGRYKDRATLELTVEAIRQKQYNSPEQKNTLAADFAGSIQSSDSCEFTDEAMQLLSEIIDQIDSYRQQNDRFAAMVASCEKLAHRCYDCLEGALRQQAGLFLAEAATLAAVGRTDRLSEVDELLSILEKNAQIDDVDLLRCRARLLAAKGKFAEAALLWGQICDARKTEAGAANQRSWKWWRSKCYQLDCLARSKQNQKENILHTIEVFQNTFTDIPTLWAEKLSLLKQQCLN